MNSRIVTCNVLDAMGRVLIRTAASDSHQPSPTRQDIIETLRRHLTIAPDSWRGKIEHAIHEVEHLSDDQIKEVLATRD